MSKRFILSLENYASFRLQFEKLSPLAEKLVPIAEANTTQLEWYAVPFANLAITASRLVVERHRTMADNLKALDAPVAALPHGWTSVSGDSLWIGRPKGYTYLI
jgi:hypothetical protein